MSDDPNIQIDAESVPTSDTDSAYGDELANYTSSLTSSVTQFTWKHGRRFASFREGSMWPMWTPSVSSYLTAPAYPLPNDEPEQERLDIIHHYILLVLNGKHFLAPASLESGGRVLNLATGTGIWAMEVADLYPACHVIGNDLSPIQPQWVPTNVTFEIDDIESPWPQRPPFTFIHARYLTGCILDWPKLAKQCLENLEPGGWAEFQEPEGHHYSEDNSISPGNGVYEMRELLIEASAKNGRCGDPGRYLEDWVKKAGFVNVHHEMFRIPFGPWPKDKRLKEIGAFHMLQFLEGLEAFALVLFGQVLGWSYEQIQVYLANVRHDAKLKGVHMMMNFHVVYGQRAPAPEREDDDQ